MWVKYEIIDGNVFRLEFGLRMVWCMWKLI